MEDSGKGREAAEAAVEEVTATDLTETNQYGDRGPHLSPLIIGSTAEKDARDWFKKKMPLHDVNGDGNLNPQVVCFIVGSAKYLQLDILLNQDPLMEAEGMIAFQDIQVGKDKKTLMTSPQILE